MTKLDIPPPDTPPTQSALMKTGVGGAVALMAAGLIDLATAVSAESLTLLNLILGLLELGVGAFLLWWVISQWLEGIRAGLDRSRELLATLQARGHTSTSGEAPRTGAPPDDLGGTT